MIGAWFRAFGHPQTLLHSSIGTPKPSYSTTIVLLMYCCTTVLRLYYCTTTIVLLHYYCTTVLYYYCTAVLLLLYHYGIIVPLSYCYFITVKYQDSDFVDCGLE